jgi:hypothetical protein
MDEDPETAQAKQHLVEEKGFPPTLVEGTVNAFQQPVDSNMENYRRNVSLLMSRLPEFADQAQTSLAAVEDMDNAQYRRTAKQLKNKIVKKIQEGGVFDEEMEKMVVGYTLMNGDAEPLLDYFQEKREGTAGGMKYEGWKPPSISNPQLGQIGTALDQNAEAVFGPNGKDIVESLKEQRGTRGGESMFEEIVDRGARIAAERYGELGMGPGGKDRQSQFNLTEEALRAIQEDYMANPYKEEGMLHNLPFVGGLFDPVYVPQTRPGLGAVNSMVPDPEGEETMSAPNGMGNVTYTDFLKGEY